MTVGKDLGTGLIRLWLQMLPPLPAPVTLPSEAAPNKSPRIQAPICAESRGLNLFYALGGSTRGSVKQTAGVAWGPGRTTGLKNAAASCKIPDTAPFAASWRIPPAHGRKTASRASFYSCSGRNRTESQGLSFSTKR